VYITAPNLYVNGIKFFVDKKTKIIACLFTGPCLEKKALRSEDSTKKKQ